MFVAIFRTRNVTMNNKHKLISLLSLYVQLQEEEFILRQHLVLLVSWLTLHLFSSHDKTKTFHRKIGVQKRRWTKANHRRFQPKRSSVNIQQFNIYDECGVMEDNFETVFQRLKWHISSSRSGSGRSSQCVQLPRVRLLMCLHWMREHPKWKHLGGRFGVSPSVAYRDVNFLLPKLQEVMHGEIAWPKTDGMVIGWEGAVGAVDGTNHPRTRVHPHQADWYRRDKGFCMMDKLCVD